MHLDAYELTFVAAWVVIGSVLGFLAFAYDETHTRSQNVRRGFVSILLGVFLSFPLVHFLLEEEYVSKHMAMLIGGIGGIGLPDIFLRYWPRVRDLLCEKAINKVENSK